MALHLSRRIGLRAGAAVLVMLGGSLLAACEPEQEVILIRPTPTGVDAADQTPETKGTPLAQLAPDDLVARLLGESVPLPGLPPAFSVNTTELLSSAPNMPKLASGLRYTIDGPDLENSVTYYLHANAEDAFEDFGTVLAGPFPPQRLDGLGYQARIISSGSPAGDVGTTRIYILAGQTIIECVSSVAQETPTGDIANVTELARVAVAHLVAVAPPEESDED
jgi:hypothetical protein